ncbi:helix-turn-helix domain-containing protein [Streptomyces bathyalis]|uniref:Helix-turn-helix domain-containing protein n=2 Tax=Streptomyces bathyalis TaxID=2710756 RepID=A0A7T1T2E4_9ACTN|nr:helix-turn-helix domain-containing protein [Streptomyces bathyalis]
MTASNRTQYPSAVMSQEMLTARQTAEMLNVSLTWIYRDAPKLGLIGYKFGRGKSAKLRFRCADVLKWLEQQKM